MISLKKEKCREKKWGINGDVPWMPIYKYKLSPKNEKSNLKIKTEREIRRMNVDILDATIWPCFLAILFYISYDGAIGIRNTYTRRKLLFILA